MPSNKFHVVAFSHFYCLAWRNSSSIKPFSKAELIKKIRRYSFYFDSVLSARAASFCDNTIASFYDASFSKQYYYVKKHGRRTD